MPPPPHASQRRMTANPVRPSRYRAGKPTGDDEDPWGSSSEEEEDDEGDNHSPAEKAPTQQPPPKATSFPKHAAANLKTVDLEARRRDAQEAEAQRIARERAERERAERDAGFVTESGSDEEEDSTADKDHTAPASARKEAKPPSSSQDEEDDTSSDDSSDQDSSSSESDAPKLIRPVFVKKSQRITAPDPASEAAAQAAAEAARRDEAANELVRDRIEKDAIARAAGRAGWDDDTPEDEIPDDTDGLDPELEHREWIARELARIKRGKDELRRREEEIEYLERRRQMNSEEREAEDMEKVRKQQDEKKARPTMAYMQKYRHKGAFYMDDEHEELRNRDLMAAQYEGQTNKELLPASLRLRDETKLGRKGATKYKDLKSEDTGLFGDPGDDRKRRGGGFAGDERFLPDRPGREAATGANAGAIGAKRRGQEHGQEVSKRPRVEGQ